MEIWLNVLTIDTGLKIGTIDLIFVNKIWLPPSLERGKRGYHIIENEGAASVKISQRMRMMTLKLTFSYQYIMNHRRIMQIHLAHIEWICCIQEYFLRGSISHYTRINFLFIFSSNFISVMNFISASLPLTNRWLSSWKTEDHILGSGVLTQALGI